MLVYCLSGLLAAFAGVMMACKLASFQASIGESWQMDSITAAVLGGTSMAGGIGTVVGTIFGGLLSSVISTCITLLRISSYWQTIVTGAVVLIAVLIDAVKDNSAIQEKFRENAEAKEKLRCVVTQRNLNYREEKGSRFKFPTAFVLTSGERHGICVCS